MVYIERIEVLCVLVWTAGSQRIAFYILDECDNTNVNFTCSILYCWLDS